MVSLKKIYLVIVVLYLLVSCQYEESNSNMVNGNRGKFLTTISPCYRVDVTRSQVEKKQDSAYNNELAVTVGEENWDGTMTKMIRGTVSGEDYTWNAIPNVALYIADS